MQHFKVFVTQHCAVCDTDGRGFEPRTTSNACGHVCNVNQKGLAAILTPTQSAGVAPEVNLRITQVRKHARDPLWALKPRIDVTRSPKNRVEWHHEKDLCPPKIV